MQYLPFVFDLRQINPARLKLALVMASLLVSGLDVAELIQSLT